MEWTRGWLFNCYGPLTFDGTGVGETPRRSLHQFAGGRSKRELVGGIIDQFVALPHDAPYGGCAESAVHECPAGPSTATSIMQALSTGAASTPNLAHTARAAAATF